MQKLLISCTKLNTGCNSIDKCKIKDRGGGVSATKGKIRQIIFKGYLLHPLVSLTLHTSSYSVIDGGFILSTSLISRYHVTSSFFSDHFQPFGPLLCIFET